MIFPELDEERDNVEEVPPADLFRHDDDDPLNLLDRFEKPPAQTRFSKAVKDNASSAAINAMGITPDVAEHAKNASDILGTVAPIVAEMAPVVGTLASGFSLLKDANAQEIVEARARATRKLYEQAVQAHFPNGLPPLAFGMSLKDLHDPKAHRRSATEAVLHTLNFAADKMDSRVRKLKVRETGSGIALAGAAAAAVGVAGAGIGAIPGIAVAAAGSAVRAAPSVHAAYRAAVKNMDGIKGVDRNSSAEFLWGLAIRKAVEDGKISQDSLESNFEANRAYQATRLWDKNRSAADLQNAQNIASKFLDDIKVTGAKSDLPMNEFLSKKGLELIANRLKSTASV